MLTYVYHAVYNALDRRLPILRGVDWYRVQQAYRKTDVNESEPMRKRAMDLMRQVGVWWANEFETQVECDLHLPDANVDAFIYCMTIALMANVLDEPVQRPPSETGESSTRLDYLGNHNLHAKAGRLTPVVSTVTFNDVGGCHNAKKRLMQLAKRVNQPSVSKRWGSRPVRGVLLKGPKGTGKTTLAQAFANEIQLPFFRFNLSDVLSVWVNHSPMLLNGIFTDVRKAGGGLLFFDEADAILVKRGSSPGHHEDNKIVNEWNICMDLLTDDDRVTVMLATNYDEKMDDAAIRDGRVDMIIEVPPPSSDAERREVFKACFTRVERRADQPIFKNNIQLSLLARRTDGLTPATIEAVINIALRHKEDSELDGKMPGLVTTNDLLLALTERLRERAACEKQPIGFSGVSETEPKTPLPFPTKTRT